MFKKYHLQEHPIPNGFQIYEARLEVMGIQHCRRDATYFAASKNVWLELEREPHNEYDPNAIRVIGCVKGLFRTKRYTVGYVPRKVAKQIAASGLWKEIRPRLEKTYVSRSGFVEIMFQVLGPKNSKAEYDRTGQSE